MGSREIYLFSKTGGKGQIVIINHGVGIIFVKLLFVHEARTTSNRDPP